ncbi:toll/interleukin-1 receptor domain-containing protein [Bacillus sp. FSL L8-0199]|uniref:toll/interleukin-1 receptor domain-containing protein n=1 Tax=Bacillus sp. FSL L8-0199 TaxID=2954616 RepID=UPI0030F979B0
MYTTNQNNKEYDFFISYNSKDSNVASWIGYILEEANYKIYMQEWDFKPGQNIALNMQKGAANSKHTLALLSSNFFSSRYTQPEWAAAFMKDPMGEERKLIPVRIEDIKLEGLLPAISYIDLVGIDNEEGAIKAILEGVQTHRNKPAVRPAFPGAVFSKKDNHDNIPQNNWYNDWLTKRINEIQTDSSSKISDGSKMVVHLIPIEAITDQKEYNISILEKQLLNLQPFCCMGWNPKINEDGFCVLPPYPENGLPHSYVQFFWNGVIESVDTAMLKTDSSGKYIPGISFEKDIINRIEEYYMQALKNIGAKLPFAISITLIDVKDAYIAMNHKFHRAKIQKDVLKLPTTIITSWDENIGKSLRPSFDRLWNNCGIAKSPNYDTDGNWRPKNY